MSGLNLEKGREPRKNNRLFTLAAITVAVSGALVYGCSSDSSSGGGGTTAVPAVPEPAPLALVGTALKCDAADSGVSTLAADQEVDPVLGVNSIPSYNISKEAAKVDLAASERRVNAQNNLKRLAPVVPGVTSAGVAALEEDGITPMGDVHPIIISYAEQVIGEYELGDGSADIGDPNQIDDIFASLSMDRGKTWKKMTIADTSKDSSIAVTWNQNGTAYPGHSHKPTMQIQGNNILVAWNDKYCPSANPFDLVKNEGDNAEEVPYLDDLYKVNGNQGTVDYEGIVAPNGKNLYEVPFSCVWTARGVLVDDINGDDTPGDYGIEWRKAQQLTSGTRDSNKIWIAPAPVGFALTWQEDPEGLRSGKGAGPGEGYSGATTNHGADIWYTYINMETFNDVCVDPLGVDGEPNTGDECQDVITGEVDGDIQLIANLGSKPVPAVNFEYPVRITNNEICAADASGVAVDNKLYCGALTEVDDPDTEVVETTPVALNCIDTTSFETGSQGNSQTVYRCIQADLDYMTPNTGIEPANAVLDGDTGASRPALKILATNADDPATLDIDETEYVAILAYEETKGLSESDPGDGVPKNGDDDLVDVTDIALEGKAVYFESFLWDQPVTVSSGRIVNLRAPEAAITQDDITKEIIVAPLTGAEDVIYQNARRVVIGGQIDSCDSTTDSGNPTFAIMYKQGYDTQGGPSDMYIRKNYGFTYDDFETVTVDAAEEAIVYNVSSHETVFDTQDPPKATGEIVWSAEENLDDVSYDYPEDNTFSPRVFLRGEQVFTGFEFTPSWRQTNQGTVPNNFWIHRYADDGEGLAWQGPQQVSIVRGAKVSTLDPRFITTAKGVYDDTLLESDKSNPDVMFLAYGTFDMSPEGSELDLFYTRSTDNGQTWEYIVDDGLGGFRTATPADFGVDTIPGTDDDDVRLASTAHKAYAEEMEVQALASPDGTMLYNAWIYETHEDCGALNPPCGEPALESMFTRVDYDTPVVAVPAK